MKLNNEYLINEAQRVGRIGTFIYEIKNDRCINSDVLNEILGLKDDYPLNFEGWLKTIHPDHREEMITYFKEIIVTGVDFNKEYKVINQADETEVWVMERGKMFFDEFGKPDKYAGTIHDVTELKRSEERYKKLYEEYEKKQALLSSVINSIPDLIFHKDISGVYLGCNKAFEAFTGMSEEKMMGKTDFDIFDKETAELFRAMDLKMLEKGEPRTNEEWVKYPDGKRVLLEALKTPFCDASGNVLGLIGVSRDITERIKKEKLQNKIKEEKRRLNELKEHDKIKTEFFTNISHELRTPVNVIFSAIQMEEIMLKNTFNGNVHKEKFKYVNMMKQNCYRLIRLINNIIDITKIDTDYFQVHKVNADIISLVEDITLSVAEYIENKGISITFDTDIEERIVACDPDKIERIILNLLSNAVKFTPSGGNIFVNIEDNIDDVCIRVKDTGTGIPDDKINSIFDRFMQVDKSLARVHEGSGIGLSIVRALVEMHGGTISAISKEGQGTEFIIHIPCKLTDNETSVCDAKIKESDIEKINIEFSDIYN